MEKPKRLCKNDRKNVTERKRVRNVRTEYEALENIFAKQKWVTGKLSSVEVLKVSYCVICEVLGKKIVLSPQSGRDPPPAKKVKTEMSSGKYNGLIPKDSHGRGSLHHYPPTTNVAEFPGCLLSKRPIADRQSGGKSPPAFASSLSNRQGENILFCSEEVTYQGETDEDENDFDEGGNFPISQEDEEAKNHPPPMLSSSSPPLTPPNFGPGISHHSVIASPSSYGCMNMDSGSSGSSNSAVMLSYSNGPWLCSPQLNFSPVETTPIHHHMGCSPLPASPLGCPVMYSPPPFTPNLFDRFD